ncbi:MAG: DUF1189 domain-containing protein [Streptococcaceae bacterium]|jgi:hypothetical protein|nr:DUF1189 domain-containing protein [Streptococcaceae bacterium]
MYKTKKLIIDSFIDNKKLFHARKTSIWKVWLLIFILGSVYSIPFAKETWISVMGITQNLNKISQKISDFKINDGKLQTKATGFICSTDNIIFIFDPETKRKVSDIAADAQDDHFSIGVTKKKLYLYFPQKIMSASFFHINNSFEIPYKDSALDEVEGKDVRKVIRRLINPRKLFLISYIVSLLPGMIVFLGNLLLLSVIATFVFSKLTRTLALKFVEIFKIMTFAAIPAIILTSVLRLIFPMLDGELLLIVPTLFVYMKVLLPNLKVG